MKFTFVDKGYLPSMQNVLGEICRTFSDIQKVELNNRLKDYGRLIVTTSDFTLEVNMFADLMTFIFDCEPKNASTVKILFAMLSGRLKGETTTIRKELSASKAEIHELYLQDKIEYKEEAEVIKDKFGLTSLFC